LGFGPTGLPLQRFADAVGWPPDVAARTARARPCAWPEVSAATLGRWGCLLAWPRPSTRAAAQLRRALRRLVRVITHRPDRSGPSDARRQTQLRRQARPGASLEVSRPCSALWSSGESGPTGAARLPMPRRPLKPVLSRAGVLRATGSMPFAASRAVAVTALSRWPARLDESGRLQRRHGSSSRCGPGRVMRRWFSRTGVTLPAPRARQPGRV
jgi:hypothetical protein